MSDSEMVESSVSTESPSNTAASPAPKGGGKPGQSGPPGNKNAAKAEVEALKRTLRVLGSRGIDLRTQVGKALALWRSELVVDLGGEENLSKQEHVLVEQATRLHLIIESVDGWLFRRKGGMINRRKHALLPVVRERASLVLALKGLLESLGLKRRAKPLPSLAEILASGESPPCTQFSESSELGSQPEEPAASTEGTFPSMGFRSPERKRPRRSWLLLGASP